MKIIFLDIDGVVNSQTYIDKIGKDVFGDPRYGHNQYQMDPEAVARLNKITDATGAKLVVSSNWRWPFIPYMRVADLATFMAGYGITGEVIGMTPKLPDDTEHKRGKEISAWLASNLYFNVATFIVLDDIVVVGHEAQQIKTEFATGLLDEHVWEAMGLLGTPEEGEQP